MNITFRPVHLDDPRDFIAMAVYASVPSYDVLVTPQARPGVEVEKATPLQRYLQYVEGREKRRQSVYVILDGERVIGDMSILMDPPHLHKHVQGTAWLGVGVGFMEYRGKGIGMLAMQELERLSREAYAVRMELGVFEFNHPARRLYAKVGFTEIGTIPNFTWFEGEMRSDIRMEKLLF